MALAREAQRRYGIDTVFIATDDPVVIDEARDHFPGLKVRHLIESYRVLQSVAECYRVLQSVALLHCCTVALLCCCAFMLLR
jgi:hypothetical protein